MCFSATASFSAGVILAATGVATLNKVETPSQKAFAVIPLLFATQQFIEGFLWLSLTYTDFAEWHLSLTYLFLIFAQLVWPVWVPYSILKMEKEGKRKTVLKGFVWLGILVSFYLAYSLLTYPVNSGIVGYHISYKLSFPFALVAASGIIYFIPTVLSPFFSSVRWMPVLGMAIFGSYLFTKFYYQEHIISIWCFLAALLSTLIFKILSAQQKEFEQKKEILIT